MRAGAGPDVRIAIDLNFNYKVEGFRRIAKKVEPYELMWLEFDLYDPRGARAHPAVDDDPDRLARNDPRPARAETLPRRALRRRRDHRSGIQRRAGGRAHGRDGDAYEVNVASHNFAGRSPR